MQGKIKWFDKKKGYGFIKCRDGSDVFMHFSNINMEGRKTLHEGDIVDFELGNRSQAVNINPILTRSMVVHELAKEELHIMRIEDNKGFHGWYVVDKSDNPVVKKEMNLKELAAYVGLDVEGLED